MSKFQKKRARRRWWFAAFALITIIIVAADRYFGTDLVGATGRFLLRQALNIADFAVELSRLSLAYILRVLVFGAQKVISYLPLIFAMRAAKAASAITMGVAADLYFSRDQKKSSRKGWGGVREKIVIMHKEISAWWHEQHFLVKCIVALGMIMVQIHLHWWLLLFPIGFMIPPLLLVLEGAQRWTLAHLFDTWYSQRFGAWHRRTMKMSATWPIVRSIVGCARRTQLYFYTGWRIWYYDKRFHFATWRPIMRTTVGRVWFGLVTIPHGEWGKYRMHRQPLLARNRDATTTKDGAAE